MFDSYLNEIKLDLKNSCPLCHLLNEIIGENLHMLHLTDALAAMKDKQAPFSIEFVTCDEANKKGGELIKLDKASVCGLPYESEQRIGVRQWDNSYHPFAVHMHLITKVNGKKVFY